MEIPDILSADLTGFTTTYPVLPRDNYTMKIGEMKVAAGKDNVNSRNLEFVLVTEYETKDTEGKPVPAGLKITDRFSLTPTDKYPKEKIGSRLRAVYEATFGKAAEGVPFNFGDTALYIGQSVTVRLDVEIDKEGKYDPKNKVSKWIPKEVVS